MILLDIFIIAFALSMDAFAVSICKGVCVKKIKLKHSIITGLYFGAFQAFMPLIGYYTGSLFENFIKSIDHWISFILLILIGINFIKESKEPFNKSECDVSFSFKSMIPFAIATSIDALAVGITLIFADVNIFISILIIGVTTFILSAIGVKIGNNFGIKYKSKSEFLGGIVLIIIGFKILFEHLELIS